MLQNRYVWAGAIIAILIVANLIRFIFSGWGLITVQVRNVPLQTVIKSIERQGWVTIYSNVDPTTPISMNVYQVPLAEAMETLATNVPPPDPGNGGGSNGGGNATGAGGNPPPSGSPPGAGGGRRGFGGGAFGGGGTTWKLAFFTAPSSSQVKEEIRNFQANATDDETKIYSYPTPLQTLATEAGMPAADPRLQTWPGMKPPAAPDAAAPAPADGSPLPDPPAPPSTVQDYLNIMAQSADIWVMSPGTWEPKISAAPRANSSIASAVKNIVSRANGSVEQAFVLYQRPRGQRGGGGGRGGFVNADTGWSMDDRLRNAINGLPADARAPALDQLNQEADFQKQVRAAPPDQRRQMMRDHFRNRLGAMDNWRKSPESRAKMYQRAVANRQSVKGQ